MTADKPRNWQADLEGCWESCDLVRLVSDMIVEIERQQAAIEHIQQERLTWAMACQCDCDACERLSSVIRRVAHRKTEQETPT